MKRKKKKKNTYRRVCRTNVRGNIMRNRRDGGAAREELPKAYETIVI